VLGVRSRAATAAPTWTETSHSAASLTLAAPQLEPAQERRYFGAPRVPGRQTIYLIVSNLDLFHDDGLAASLPRSPSDSGYIKTRANKARIEVGYPAVEA
jgi:hypothetical protein